MLGFAGHLLSVTTTKLLNGTKAATHNSSKMGVAVSQLTLYRNRGHTRFDPQNSLPTSDLEQSFLNCMAWPVSSSYIQGSWMQLAFRKYQNTWSLSIEFLTTVSVTYMFIGNVCSESLYKISILCGLQSKRLSNTKLEHRCQEIQMVRLIKTKHKQKYWFSGSYY